MPRDFATQERRTGFWRPVDEGPTDRGFIFRVRLRDPEDPGTPRGLLHEFNLSPYSHSADPPADRSQRFTYDSAGNLVEVRDGLGGLTGMSYNSDGTLDGFVDARNQTTRFAYDLKGRMRTVTTEGNRVNTLDYDEAGNLLPSFEGSCQATNRGRDRDGSGHGAWAGISRHLAPAEHQDALFLVARDPRWAKSRPGGTVR